MQDHSRPRRRSVGSGFVVAVFVFSHLFSTARADFLATDAFNDQVALYSDNGGFKRIFVASGSGGLNAPFSMAMSASGELFVAGGTTNKLLVYDGQSGAFKRSISNGNVSDQSFGMMFTPNGDLLASSGNQVFRINPSTGATIATIGAGQFHTPGKMILAPDGKVFVGSNGGPLEDRSIWKIDLSTNLASVFIDGATSPVHGAFGFDYGPDGMLYAGSLYDDYDIWRINPNTGQVLGMFADNTTSNAVSDVLFVPGNRMWAAGVLSSNLTLFNATTGEYISDRSVSGPPWDLLYVPEPHCGALAIGLALLGRRKRSH